MSTTPVANSGSQSISAGRPALQRDEQCQVCRIDPAQRLVLDQHLPEIGRLGVRQQVKTLSECLDIHSWDHVDDRVFCGEKVKKGQEYSTDRSQRFSSASIV
jgi:hypothetical protein